MTVERGIYAFIFCFNERKCDIWTNKTVIHFTISIATYIYFRLFYYISISYNFFLLWDVGTLDRVFPISSLGSKHHQQSKCSGQAVARWCWITSPSLFCCFFGQNQHGWSWLCRRPVYSWGILDIIRAVLTSLLEGHFGSSLGNFYWWACVATTIVFSLHV